MVRKVAGNLTKGDIFMRHDVGGSYPVEVVSDPESYTKALGTRGTVATTWVKFEAEIVKTGEVYTDQLYSLAPVDLRGQ